MRELHGDRSLADRRCHALDRLVSHVTGAKDARDARFE
jgi:hypothetical protein